MTTAKNQKNKGQHGGKRPGAGRPRKDRSPKGRYDSAMDYLQAIVCGDETPDALRISAAKTLLAYEAPKRRTKPKSPPPRKLAEQEESSIERENQAAFEGKAAVIRKKYRRE